MKAQKVTIEAEDGDGRTGRKERPIVLMQSANRATNSQLAICGSALFCSTLYIFSSGGSQPWRFSFGDIDFRPPSFERGRRRSSSRCTSQRQSVSRLSERILEAAYKAVDRALRPVKRERRGRKRKRRKTERGSEEERTNARIHSALFKRGDSPPPLPPPPPSPPPLPPSPPPTCLWDTMMKLFRPPSLRK